MSHAKKAAAEKAVQFIEQGMTVGLGTGTTAYWAIQEIGKQIQQGLKIKAVASSVASEQLAAQAGIEIVSFTETTMLDLYIDGADEVDEEKNLIKGGGGALLREKILAYNSKQFIVIVDELKLVQQLGAFRLPVEMVQFAHSLTMANINKMGGHSQLRMQNDTPFVTDNGNYIADCDFGPISNPAVLNEQLHGIPGVVETGLFPHFMVSKVIVGTSTREVKLWPAVG